MKKLILVVATYIGAFVVVVPIAFLFVIFLAGPHADLLPQPLEVAVGITGWLAVIVLPLLAARVAWRRAGRKCT